MNRKDAYEYLAPKLSLSERVVLDVIYNGPMEQSRVLSDGWRDVRESLPGADIYALWIHENGYIFMESISADWDSEYLEYFLGGYGNKETNGRIVAWMMPPAPPAFA